MREEESEMTIFSHVVLGTNDLGKARSFYDATLAPLGISRMMDTDDRAMWGEGGSMFMVARPVNGEPASHANGGTIGFAASNSEAIDKFHAAALANGGTCEGAPGLRPQMPGLYAAYVRDPDGNKICAVHFNQAAQ
jgi:catechol 2,3-dioxygenase-like lactoylglutathione lyase family enzyme